MKIQQFQGGLSTRLKPQFLNVNEGVVYENIDNSLGTLSPVKKNLATAIALEQYHTWYDTEQEWVDSTTKRDYLEYKGVLYWTDRVSTPQRYDGSAQTNLGITPPPKLVGTINYQPAGVKDITVKSVVGTGLPNDTLRYMLVNVDGSEQSNAVEVVVSPTSARLDRSNLFEAPEYVFVQSGTLARRDVVIEKPVGITLGSTGVEVYRYYKAQWYRVGVLPNAAATITDNVEDISANPVLDESLFGELQGTYQYQMTYYNSTTGSESGPSPLSDEFALDDGGNVTFTSLPVSSDPQVTHKRLYRIGGNLTSMTRVVELTNATASYTDVLRDTEVEGTILETAIALQAPAGLKFLTEAYAMLFAALGSQLRFTPIGKPDQWPSLYFLEFDANITGLAAVTSGILVFTKFKTYLVTGTGPTSLAQQLISSDQGCIAHESVQVVAGTAMWASTDGICASSGNLPQVISKDKLGKISLDPVDSVIYDENYYVLESDGSALILDYAYGGIYKRLNSDVLSLAVANDVLYGWQSGVLEIISGSDEPASFSYLSPRFIEGSATNSKLYKNIRFFHKGDIMVKVLIDDEVVIEKELTGTDSDTIKVPQEKQRGQYIQVQITGTGEVYEYEYLADHQKNA